MKRKEDIDDYLKKHRGLAKWINVCNTCKARGYKPDLPENIYPHFNVGAANLRSYFSPLSLNEYGWCEQCAASYQPYL